EAPVSHEDSPNRVVTMDFRTLTDADEVYLVSTVRSSTKTDESERDERLSERRLEVALTGTNTGVWEWDMETDVVYWSESMERLFGLEPGTFEGTFEAFGERVHPEDLPAVQQAIETTVEDGDPFEAEYRIQRDDGDRRWVRARAELYEPEDSSDVMIGIVTDITDRKENERQLHEQQRQYRDLVERLPDAYYVIDGDWRVTFCNEVIAERLGTTVDELVDKTLWEVFPASSDSVIETRFRRVMETGEPESFEYHYESEDRWVRIQAYPYEDGIAAISTDISDKQQELASILNAAPIALYRFDSDGVFREARGELLSRLGIEPDELLGESMWELYSDNEQVREAAERALDGETFRYTLTLGDITLETQYTPVYTDGEVTGVIGVSMDVTEIHRQRKRMEFFNSILRHDVLNGMMVIKMRGEILADDLEGDHQRYAQTIVDWCTTTTDVVKRVRRVVETLATPEEEYTLSPIDISAILDRKGRELRTAYPEVEFDIDVPDDLNVHADELLTDVLGNVLTNSIEHNDSEGLRVEITADVDDDTVRLRIADNGKGVADGRRESIFRRGETSSKETGSGFGLFFVDVMVEKYGGDVRVEDSDAGGACFVIELPRAGGTDGS
ncbi:MAG: PAS domain-containing protein, partial [Halovenus sp.]